MNLFTLAQNLAPQQTLSEVAGYLAKSQNPYIKKAFVHTFAKVYNIDLAEYERGNLDDYDSFNDFFTRELKSGMRPIDETADGIACPADGKISQIGAITNGQLLQAKGRDYDVGQLWRILSWVKRLWTVHLPRFILPPPTTTVCICPLTVRCLPHVTSPVRCFRSITPPPRTCLTCSPVTSGWCANLIPLLGVRAWCWLGR